MISARLIVFLVIIVASIPACHAGDRNSIPRRGDGVLYDFTFKYLVSFWCTAKKFSIVRVSYGF